ncbi:uncharacterized protein LOC111343504 [Stylophora pistillata]|uniref:uncharacterized protein LOC111343504 n=1 Tax=Stylophora pistillata TaxID=50429 RepID=UPI000C0481F6|nr:uncharacterized protein LOC111343504 [Stylophora pistillata]
MYPRWKEELENYRLGQQQDINDPVRNGPSTTPLTSSLKDSRLQPHFPVNTPVYASTRTNQHSSVSAVYSRSPPTTNHPADHRYPHDHFSYLGSSHPNGSGPPPSGYYASDSRWQSPGYYDSQRPLDSRMHQGHLSESSRGPVNVQYRSPDHYYGSPGDQFYDRRPHPGEIGISRNGPLASCFMYSDIPHPRLQEATPYEPRMELQRTHMGYRNHLGLYEQNGYPEQYNQGGMRQGYGGPRDHRAAEFEPNVMSRKVFNGEDNSFDDKAFDGGLPKRPVMEKSLESAQDTKPSESYTTGQPFVTPEKPLERSNPMTSLKNPPLSSPVSGTSVVNTNQEHHFETREDDTAISPMSSQATSNVLTDKPEKESVLKNESLPAEGSADLETASKPKVEPVKAVEISNGRPQEQKEGKSVDTKIEERIAEAPGTPQELHKVREQSDDEESLDLSDLSLPDGGDAGGTFYVPSQIEHKNVNEPNKNATLSGDLEISASVSKPAVIPDYSKSFTEDISEDIPESVLSENERDAADVPVHEEKEKLPSTVAKVTEQSGRLDTSDNTKKGDDTDGDEVVDDVKTEVQAEMTHEEIKPSVSLDGFLCLLQAVDADVEVSFSPETLYHSPSCSSDMRAEITKAVEVGSSLQSLDPNTISMIVLEELPLLVSSSPAGCLIPDRVFSQGLSCETEKELRPLVEASLMKLWKELFSHLVNVVKNNVMSAEEVGDTFGSLLITQSSKYWRESQQLLRRILEAAVSDVSSRSTSPPASTLDELDHEPQFENEAPAKQDDDEVSIATEASSSTLGSTPPKIEPNKSKEENRQPTPDPTVSYEDDFEDEVPLTETPAYLKMMSSAHSEPDDDISDPLAKTNPQKQESEADEDVERELARSISPPMTSPSQKSHNHSKSGRQKPKLSLFETDVNKKTDKDLSDSWGGTSLKSAPSNISDSDSVASPPLSPDDVIGYTPTALENQQKNDKVDKENDKSEPKSVTDSKAKRKTDFWNASDTESEVDLQLSTGGMDQEDDDDDFDFYG